MANGILILGPSGSGKTTSLGKIPELEIEGLNPSETLIINVKGKPLPFKNWQNNYTKLDKDKGNHFISCNFTDIIKVLNIINTNRKDIKNIVVDDTQYLMSDYFMKKAFVKGFEKFTELAKYTYDVIDTGLGLRDDINFIVLSHSEETKDSYKAKTIGKMLDEKITIEGLFTVVLYADQIYNENTNKIEKRFVTNFDGQYPAKSPIGMFNDTYIKNDMGYVIKEIKKYYGN